MFRRVRTPEAIEALFAEHFDPIYRFAVYRVGRDAAADVAAETFAQALRSADRMDPTRDGRAYGAGDTIRVWVISVGGKRLVVAAETERPPPGLHPHARREWTKAEREMASIIRSIRFR